MSEGRVERRLAAIMAADVVGYSRLMGADEEGGLRNAAEPAGCPPTSPEPAAFR
jgi:adenylate cyclase